MLNAPHDLEHNVKASPRSPISEFFLIISGMLAVLLVVYYLLGFAVDFAAGYVPREWEKKMNTVFGPSESDSQPKELIKQEEKVKRVLDKLLANVEGHPTYDLKVADVDMVNVISHPGYTVEVFTGFLDNVESENELAMVLAHEIGHYEHRDHTRQLGRILIPVVLVSLLSGTDEDLADWGSSILGFAELSFSRSQEHHADAFALKLLNKTYGHSGGATDFFERHQESEGDPGFLEFFATHPADIDRVSKLDGQIRENGYDVKKTLRWRRKEGTGAEEK
ncbi:MAG: M48 family metallopeptidase [Candidatus Lindowbacteria bacterium]|nr:M48 family metallopeptidase [Candidatus Lindowbacteria bacterium]